MGGGAFAPPARVRAASHPHPVAPWGGIDDVQDPTWWAGPAPRLRRGLARSTTGSDHGPGNRGPGGSGVHDRLGRPHPLGAGRWPVHPRVLPHL